MVSKAYASWDEGSVYSSLFMIERCSYNSYFSAELILDLTLLVCIWTFLLDDGEELLDTHLYRGFELVLSSIRC